MKLTLEQQFDSLPKHLLLSIDLLIDGKWVVSIWDASRGRGVGSSKGSFKSIYLALKSARDSLPSESMAPALNIQHHPIRKFG